MTIRRGKSPDNQIGEISELYGLSTDIKPTNNKFGYNGQRKINIKSGSTFMEVDTKKIFIFNEDANSSEGSWTEI